MIVLPQRKEVTELKCKLENPPRAREGPCCMPSSQPASSGLPSCSLEGNFYQMVFETASIIQEIAGRAERRRGQCMQGIPPPTRTAESNLFPNGDRPSAHSSGGAWYPRSDSFLLRAASERELWIQPIVCFQIHFEFLSPKLERKKLQIEFLPALACPPLPGRPLLCLLLAETLCLRPE